MLDQLIDDLRKDEGWRDRPYQDSLGFWTVGYGFLIDVRKPWKLPKLAGEHWLRALVYERTYELTERWPWFQHQPASVRRALTNMAYQLGTDGLLKFTNMLEALKVGDRKAAADHALDSKWARIDTPERALRMAALIRGDED